MINPREQFTKETGKRWVSNRTLYMEWLENKVSRLYYETPEEKIKTAMEGIRIAFENAVGGYINKKDTKVSD